VSLPRLALPVSRPGLPAAARAAGLTLGLVLAAALPAEACPWCLTSATGEGASPWPYLSLIAVPFVLATVIGGVLARSAGLRWTDLAGRLAHRVTRGAPPAGLESRTKETT
jgi:hypothetical protein